MTLTPGTRVGPYEIRSPVGTGGMGEVYLAHDPRLGRDVAVKILRSHLAGDPAARSRFEREARAVAGQSHPNILAVYDVGDFEGASYIVTELLEGETLRDRLNRSPLPWARAVEIGAAIADGVAAAHARGIIHRDLKPENIFLTSDGRVKILDFGLAAFTPSPVPGSSSGADTVTQAGVIVGTVGYMSPEQVRGQATGPSGDVFALGCVLYEMVAGRRAFARETAVQTLTAILEYDPPPPSASAPEIPPRLDGLISRCLEKNPAQRMESARDLAFALRELPEHATAGAGKPPGGRNSRRAVVISTLGVAVLAVVTLGPLRERLTGAPSPGPIESLAVLPLANVSGDPAQDFYADGITEALITDLSGIGGLRVIAHAAVVDYRESRMPLADIARELGVQALVTGSVLRSDDRVRVAVHLVDSESGLDVWSKSYERDLGDVLALQSELARAIAERVRVTLSANEHARLQRKQPVDPGAYESYLRALYLLGTGTTEETSQETIDLLKRAIAQDPTFAPAHAALAIAYINRRTEVAPEEAGVLDPQAFAAVERALSLDPELAQAYVARGDLLWTPSHRFAHERSVREYRRALERNANQDDAHAGLARIFAHVGFFTQALDHAEKALDSNPSNALALHHKSEALLWMGRNEEALAVLTSIPRPVFPELVEAHTAWALSRLGRWEEARTALRAALSRYPDDRSGVLQAVEALLLSDTDRAAAEQRIEAASRTGGFNPSHHTTYFIAAAWGRMGNAARAVSALRETAETGFPCTPLIEGDSNLDPIRDDSEFRAFLTEMQNHTTTLRAAVFPSGT